MKTMRQKTRFWISGGLLLAGCGLPPGHQTTLPRVNVVREGNGIATQKSAFRVSKDVSWLDLSNYLKVAKLYAMLELPYAELDYSGSQWLDEGGFVLPKTEGWLFGFWFRARRESQREFAAVRVDQRHQVSRVDPQTISHRGNFPLSLVAMPSPRHAIKLALAQDLPKGDRYAVEYLSPTQEEGPVSVVTSYHKGVPLGQIQID